jgi:surfeit locus 1 family protein
VITPLVSDRGFTVLVNRGFVPPERADPQTRKLGQIAGPVLVTGLLRISEPHGGFLRRNDPFHRRWYSRDVAAIAAAQRLSPGLTAPYFIDADATQNPGGLPVGGLTVIAFPNSHLVYALTWYGLALLVAVGFAYAAREEWRIRGGARAR